MRKHLLVALIALYTQTAMAGDWWNDVKNDRVDSVAQDIAEGQDPNEIGSQGHPAIIYAIRQNSPRVYMALAQNPQVDVNLANRYDETPLMYAAIIGNVDLAKALIARGAKVNRLGWSPLHYAASKGQTQMVEYLLSQGASPNAPSDDGNSSLIVAVTSGNLDTVKTLLAAGADPKAINQKNKNAIDVAREMKRDDMLEVLEKKN
ncbi:ankyrin repeat domain-containing protein [Pelistega europaea]|uniref:Ankyrin repeat domain-containing protein n=1 Tax=Pelistega europaea TaxID=106147 RepID=A0A7Y4L8L7_9BURK|nr:ankyrin repeat domain-containing protein [Pelistega europaea]NOL48939.1 ankyrin repeat domain-containing protein [Pelistega europaea]